MTDPAEPITTIPIGLVLFVAEEDSSPDAVFRPALVASAIEAVRFLDVPGGWPAPARTGTPAHRVRAEISLRHVSADYVRAIRDRAHGESGMYQQAVLGPLASRVAEIQSAGVVLTDLAITPPREWRYIIWDVTPSGAVISAAPLDPAYWEPSAAADMRRSTIARRATAAQLCVMGSLLGLRRCDNERCFMFGNIDSVTRLDNAEIYGPEHEIEELTSRRLEQVAR